MPDETQRHAIVETARHLFVSKGYGATTTGEIAAACKISKQTLYRLFPGKPALFNEVISSMRDKWLNFPADDTQPMDRALEDIFCAGISEEANRERLELLRVVLAEGGRFPELREAVHNCGREASRAALTGWLDKQRAKGLIKHCDTRRAAGMLMDMIFGALTMKNVDSIEWPGNAEWFIHIRSCVSVFLHGVCSNEAG
ncbi:TetR/AcrR family transcriptional regulator [Acidocella sp.]|uniref:TetR/AcrR family transcriptional regulator n=1 Tax=Acidocella sp. TaxID=50710 RepID=UPI003D01472C